MRKTKTLLIAAAAMIAAAAPSRAEDTIYAAMALQVGEYQDSSWGPRAVQWASTESDAVIAALKQCYKNCDPDAVVTGVVGLTIMFGWVKCDGYSILSRSEKDENDGRADMVDMAKNTLKEEGHESIIDSCYLDSVYSVKTGVQLVTWK